MIKLPIFIFLLLLIVIIVISFFIGILLGTNKRKDLEIEISLLNKQLDKYKKHEEYRKLDIKVLDDDIEIDKMLESIKEDR